MMINLSGCWYDTHQTYLRSHVFVRKLDLQTMTRHVTEKIISCYILLTILSR